MAEEKYTTPTDQNLDPPTQRMRLSAMSVPSLQVTGGLIQEEAKRELRFPQSIKTYNTMLLEPTLSSAISLFEVLITRCNWEVKTKLKASEEEKQRADFINKSLKKMRRPWEEYLTEIVAYLRYGFQPMEKVYSKIKSGEHEGKIALTDLRTISQSTVTKWIFELNTGYLAGLRQDLSAVASDFKKASAYKNKGLKVDIPRKKFLLFRNSPRNDNPEGVSPLRSCYIPWKQKTLVEDFELIAVSKDLGGIPVIGVDAEFLRKASVAGSDEASVLDELKLQAANLNAGEQAYVLKPIAYDEKGKELFTFDLTLSPIGGRTNDTDSIIKRNENKMLMAFLADVLKLGTESHGSYALADSKTSLLAMGVEHHLKNIARTLNHDLLKQIYSLNGWEYTEGESAEFVYGDIEKQDLDELGKFIQRVFSVGAVRPTKQIEDMLTDVMGAEAQEESDMQIIETENTSRAGEGQGTSGTGNSQSSDAGSDTNSDNAS